MNPAELFRQETDTLQLAPGRVPSPGRREGRTRIVALSAEGEIDIFLGDFVLETAGAGSLLGEMALIDDTPRTANAVAKKPASGANNRRADFIFWFGAERPILRRM